MLVEAPAKESLADLLHRLGDISPERIRMYPFPGTATVEDVVEIEQSENRLFELVDGVLVEKIMGYHEAWAAAMLIYAIQNHVLPRDLGVVTGPDGMIRFPENFVRMPDVAFASWDRFPDGEIPDDPAPEIVPDLVVEVLSKGNTPREMSRKIKEYFKAGVPLVWIIEPKKKTAAVYTSPARFKVIPPTGKLDGAQVLPGFELPLAKIFEKPKRPTTKRKRNGS